jgi:ketosteroid isomerase-like protein
MDESSRSAGTIRTIAEARVAFSDAVSRGDTKAAASAYADTARLVAPSTDLFEGREAIEAFWQAGLDAGIAAVEFEAVAVQDLDRAAYEIGRYVLRMQSATDGTVVDRGRYVLVLQQRADGSWCRAVEMFSPDPPSAVPAGGGQRHPAEKEDSWC